MRGEREGCGGLGEGRGLSLHVVTIKAHSRSGRAVLAPRSPVCGVMCCSGGGLWWYNRGSGDEEVW